MPGYGPSHVKCEPPSDEEDNCQYGNYYETEKPLNIEYDGDVSADILDQLQFSSELVAVPAAPAATPVCAALPAPREASLALLEPVKTHLMQGSELMEKHISLSSATDILDTSDFAPLLNIKDEPLSEGEGQQLSGDEASEGSTPETSGRGAAKSWSQLDMERALDALKNHHMSLTKASSTYGIPSTTLWQRAHRMGIDTPKKEGSSKSWTDDDLKAALHALRTGAISANKASKAYGIPSSTLYKIARREGIRLAAPFNAAPTSWQRADLQRALDAIRCGAASVQRAASHYGIPTGTLYGRCKREGIDLSRSNPTPWSEDAMGEALEASRPDVDQPSGHPLQPSLLFTIRSLQEMQASGGSGTPAGQIPREPSGGCSGTEPPSGVLPELRAGNALERSDIYAERAATLQPSDVLHSVQRDQLRTSSPNRGEQ
ncbi:uncharacterized protein LOC123710481 isoform X2 [Pieris brassicae]|uniref:uncharacterized protein LOC123710481 isoform X2 n=1 Tax=Pieris brassicae TaxID=7116 RepID=UPI001E66289E|nr:uncharacterized protein LOC123710481 isoform X2 [Pieris brassicae]